MRIADVVLPFVNDRALGERVESVRAPVVRRARGRILEIGAGTGLNFHHYAAETEVVAIEPASSMRQKAERRAREPRTRARITLMDADATALPFDAGSFDTVLATFVLCSVDELDRALAEIARVLAPGGELLLAEHVRSRSPRVARWQERVQPVWGALLGGCRLDRDPIPSLERAGLDPSGLEAFDLPLPWIVRQGLTGVARR